MLICKATFGLVMVKWCQEIVFVLSMGETKGKVLSCWFISKRKVVFEWFVKNNMFYSFGFMNGCRESIFFVVGNLRLG
jgi:hypothetical protein